MTERYDQLRPEARALVDDYDALDLADMLVTAKNQLAALRAVARGYCPTCGRGDAAPTVDDWEQQRDRAQQLAGVLTDVLRHFVHKGHPGEPCLSSGWISEKTVARWRTTLHQPAPDPAATRATEHVYLSTGCWHGDHGYCKSMTGLNGAKRPGECKKCGAKCICVCHQEQS